MAFRMSKVSKVQGDVRGVKYGVSKRDYHPGGTGHCEGGGIGHDWSCIWRIMKSGREMWKFLDIGCTLISGHKWHK